MAGFELLEHTADVGILARGDSPEEVVEQASLGLLDIMGAWAPGTGERIDIELEARDLGALLIAWLNEIVFIVESRDCAVAGLGVERAGEGGVRGWVSISPRKGASEGTAVKAATYHRLEIGREGDSWSARVYLDV
jgi:SHS2 domain-containing protein